MFHVTNGDSAAALIEASGVPGEVLPWRDVLHEGPVPVLPDAALRRVRATYLAALSGHSEPVILRSLEERDQRFEKAIENEEVVLWFEHDLYDQLQLLQILDRIARLGASLSGVRLICIGDHPTQARFEGLGNLEPVDFPELFEQRERVSPEQVALAQAAWQAFCSNEPMHLALSLRQETPSLPFLAPALRRHLEQYPSTRGGVRRTDHTTLDALAQGVERGRDLFQFQSRAEEAPFLGDLVFWTYLDQLTRGPRPLLCQRTTGPMSADSILGLTQDGKRVQSGEGDAIAWNGIDRWWGGVHQTGDRARWRWDRQRAQLVEDR